MPATPITISTTPLASSRCIISTAANASTLTLINAIGDNVPDGTNLPTIISACNIQLSTPIHGLSVQINVATAQ